MATRSGKGSREQNQCYDCDAKAFDAICAQCSKHLCKLCFVKHSCDIRQDCSESTRPNPFLKGRSNPKFTAEGKLSSDPNRTPGDRVHEELEDVLGVVKRKRDVIQQKAPKAPIKQTQPGRPHLNGIPSSDTVALTWKKPTDTFNTYTYEIRYKPIKGSSRWTYYTTENDQSSAMIRDLKPKSEYKFQVKMIRCGDGSDDDEEGSFSEISDPIATTDSTAMHIDKRSVEEPNPPADMMQPGRPRSNGIPSSDTIALKWKKPTVTFNTYTYEIRYKPIKGSSRWTYYITENDQSSAMISDLKPKTEYKFQVKMIRCGDGSDDDEEGSFSEISDPIATTDFTAMHTDKRLVETPSSPADLKQPGRPRSNGIPSSDTIELTWKKPTDTFNTYTYEIRYKSIKGSSRWTYYTTENDESSAMIRDLKPKTEYKFQVKMIRCGDDLDDDEEGSFSEISDPIATTDSTAMQIDKRSTETSNQPANRMQPGRPRSSGIPSDDTIALTWKKPTVTFNTYTYEIRYKPIKGSSRWTYYTTENDQASAMVQDLKPKTEYKFQVKMIRCGDGSDDDEEGSFSEISDPIATTYSTAMQIEKRSTETSNPPANRQQQQQTKSHHSSIICKDNPADNQSSPKLSPRSRSSVSPVRSIDKSPSPRNSRRRPPERLKSSAYTEFQRQMDPLNVQETPVQEEPRQQARFGPPPNKSFSLSPARPPSPTNVQTISSRKKTTMQLGKPFAYESPSSDTIVLTWEKPERTFSNCKYEIWYKPTKDNSNWKCHGTQNNNTSAKITELKSNTEYIFQVTMISDTDDNVYSERSELSDPIATTVSPAERFLECTAVYKQTGNIEIRKFYFEEEREARDVEAKTRRLTIGGQDDRYTPTKTIMLVGETGSGKSALIDRIINYVFGVKWEDPFRYKLVDLEDNETYRGSEMSQTQWITTYSIAALDGGNLDFRLNIIDTPGYGDTAGVDRDKEITNQIKTLFVASGASGISELEAVCFIVKSSTNRLNSHQKYIFKSILKLFGKDIEENIVIIWTFSPSNACGDSKILKSANVPQKHMFTFENVPLDQHYKEHETYPISWKNGGEEMCLFFTHVQTLKKVSLTVSGKVLLSRELAEAILDNLVPLIETNMLEHRNLQRTRAQLLENQDKMNNNVDFTFTRTEVETIKVDLPLGQKAMTCPRCKRTCHKPCDMWDFTPKRLCKIMSFGLCELCSCGASVHDNGTFEYGTKEHSFLDTYSNMKNKYQAAEKGVMTSKTLLKEIQNDIDTKEASIKDKVRKLRECYELLTYKALLQSRHQGIDRYIWHSIEKKKRSKEEKDALMAEILKFL